MDCLGNGMNMRSCESVQMESGEPALNREHGHSTISGQEGLQVNGLTGTQSLYVDGLIILQVESTREEHWQNKDLHMKSQEIFKDGN
jgi:hypothetical protein